jgi:CRP-like cAMP-binding protein
MLQLIDRPSTDFGHWATASLDDLYREKKALLYSKGKDIPLFDRDILFVQRGIVQLFSYDSEGNEILLGLISPAMPFGLPLTFLESYNAIALSTVSLVRFTIAEIEQYTDLNRLVLRGLDLRLQQSEAIQYILCSRQIKEKLYRFLMLLCREVGEPVTDGTRLTIKFTHQHLANAIGTTRVTITRTLKKFEQDGTITFDRKRHIVMDASKQFSEW